jgi:hypothetical protein
LLKTITRAPREIVYLHKTPCRKFDSIDLQKLPNWHSSFCKKSNLILLPQTGPFLKKSGEKSPSAPSWRCIAASLCCIIDGVGDEDDEIPGWPGAEILVRGRGRQARWVAGGGELDAFPAMARWVGGWAGTMRHAARSVSPPAAARFLDAAVASSLGAEEC